MKPRTKLEHECLKYSKYIDPIGHQIKDWAFKVCLEHKGYATRSRVICMDCGDTFSPDIVSRKRATCPNCGTRLKVTDTRKKTDFQKNYFAVAEVHERFQLIRYFEIVSRHKAGKDVSVSVWEILQEWIRDDGKLTRVGHLHTNFDSWGGDWSIRKPGRSYYSNWKYKLYPYRYYPKSKFKKEFRKHGIDHRIYGINIVDALRIVPNIPQAETLLKAKQYSLLYKMVDYPQFTARRWASIKICMRNNYKVKDAGIWYDYLDLLEYFGKDLRNAKYVCPKDLNKAHDRLVIKKQLLIAKRNEEERKQKILRNQSDFIRHIQRFMGLTFSDKKINVVVLESVDQFLEESEKLKHCLFTNEYFAKNDSLILSARIDGVPIETIEVSLSKMKLVQARGMHNNPSEHHDSIVSLVKKNMGKIRALANDGTKGKRNIKSLKSLEYAEAV